MSEVVDKKIWGLAGPIFVELLLSITLLVTDTFFLSKISDAAASSIGATLAVINVCIFLFEALAQGGGSVAAQYLGAKKNREVGAVYAASLMLNLAAGAVISLFFLLFHDNAAVWLGFSKETMGYASLYMAIIGTSAIIQAAKFFYSSVIASVGQTYWNMIITIAANILNIVLNCIFISGAFGNLGVAGVAAATVISYMVSVCIAAFIVHHRMKISFAFKALIKDFKGYVYPILSISVPSALEPVSYHLSQLCVSIMVIKMGDVTMAAKTYVYNISYINYVWYYAIAIAAQILIAHMVGARLFDRANKMLKTSLLQGVLGSLAITVLAFVSGRWVLSFFTQNEEIISLGTRLLGLGVLFGILSAGNTIISFALRAAGDAKYTSFMGIIVMWIIGIPFCYYLGITLGYGMVGILIGMIIDELLRIILNYRRWAQRKWENKGAAAKADSLQAVQAE